MRIGINATTQLGRSDIAGFTQHALTANLDSTTRFVRLNIPLEDEYRAFRDEGTMRLKRVAEQRDFNAPAAIVDLHETVFAAARRRRARASRSKASVMAVKRGCWEWCK